MEIKEITDRQTWENFLREAKPHTFLQSWNWGEFNAVSGHKIWRLGVYSVKGGSASGGEQTLVAVAFVVKVIARRGAFLFCPHGFVSLPPASFRETFDSQSRDNEARPSASILNVLTAYLKPLALAEGCAFIRFSPALADTVENNAAFTDIGYREAPTHMMHPELAWILDITPTEEQLLAGMRKTTRYSIKKAEKDGVVITTSTNPADFEKFYEVYKQTITRQEFKGFSESYFKAEIEIFFKENAAQFFFAQYQGEVVGTAFIVFYGDSAFYHHGATTRKFPGLTDAQLLQWHVIKEAKARGLKFYNFWGVVPEDKKSHPWAGLSTFKRGFGGKEEPYVHAKDLVLSPRYWLTYLIEKARRIKRGL